MDRIRFIITVLFFLLKLCSVDAQVKFVIRSLPSGTPYEDTIFISGTFNDWTVNDNNYMLRKELDGNYAISLMPDTNYIEFKFTRGSWLKVETDELNEYIPNRVYQYSENEVVYIDIDNWLDLGGAKRFNYIVFILFAFAFTGLILILYVSLIRDKRKHIFKNFLLLNVFITSVLIATIIYNQSNIIWQSKIYMVGYIMLFLWGPILYFFICAIRYDSKGRKLLKNLIPALLISLWVILSFMNFKPISFQLIEIYQNLSLGSFVIITISIFFNLFYHIKLFSKILKDKELTASKSRLSFSVIIFFISSGALIFLITDFFASFILPELNFENKFEIVILFISLILFIEFHFFWKYPEIIRKNENSMEKFAIVKRNNKKNKLLPAEFRPEEYPNLNEYELILAKKLFSLMEETKPYKDPDLTVAKLSEQLDTKSHILSKILNEEFNLHFRDFINNYRIKEFVKIANSQDYKNYTLLALAFEVGFNSKSTFNLAFKKITGLSPGKYLEKMSN
jgi:AraC-like DNA-binding protein